VTEIQVYPDSEQLAQALIAEAVELIKSTKIENIAVSGGGLGILVATGLIQKLSDSDLLSKLKFYLADERFVTLDQPDSNLGQILSKTKHLSPSFYQFPLPSEHSLKEAANVANDQFGADFKFDLVLLGIGPDGHTASLFPSHSYPETTVVEEPNSPKPPAERLSFSYKVFNSSENVWFAVSGEEKATAVSQALSGNTNLPAGSISGAGNTKWFITEELA